MAYCSAAKHAHPAALDAVVTTLGIPRLSEFPLSNRNAGHTHTHTHTCTSSVYVSLLFNSVYVCDRERSLSILSHEYTIREETLVF